MELTYFDVVALIDDLREENANLTARIAEVEAKVAEQKALVQHQHLWQEGEDAKERAHLERLVPVLKSRIDVLDAKIKKSLYFIRKLRMYCFNANWDYSDPEEADEFNEFDAAVCEYLSEYKEREE